VCGGGRLACLNPGEPVAPQSRGANLTRGRGHSTEPNARVVEKTIGVDYIDSYEAVASAYCKVCWRRATYSASSS
jgi:hypothetical protein